jgi:hypothetical protein
MFGSFFPALATRIRVNNIQKFFYLRTEVRDEGKIWPALRSSGSDSHSESSCSSLYTATRGYTVTEVQTIIGITGHRIEEYQPIVLLKEVYKFLTLS